MTMRKKKVFFVWIFLSILRCVIHILNLTNTGFFTENDATCAMEVDTNADADSDQEDVTAPVKRRRKMVLIVEEEED